MTPEERKEYDRRRYEKRRKQLAKKGKRYQAKLRERMREYKAKWREEHYEEQRAKAKARWDARNTEEFRAQRRAAYAAKHANDPMTEHRRACIEAAKKRTETPLEERKALKAQAKAEKAAKKDMQEQGYLQAERESERDRETVIKYIRQWTQRKKLGFQPIRDGDTMSEADVKAYYKEAHRYFEIRERLDKTDPKDYTMRNLLSYKLRVIEEHFNTLLNQRLRTKNQLKSE
jgi:hypothetical protein